MCCTTASFICDTFLKPSLVSHGLLAFYIIVIPLRVTVSAIKLAELPGKILVVHVQPVVFWQVATYHFFIVNNIVRDLGIF
jgi:hypothetical protein